VTEQAPPDRQRPTSHRAAPSSSDLLRRFAPPLVAVSAVVVVILLLLVLNARPSPPGPAPGAVAQPPTAATAPALSSPPALTAPTTPSASPASSSAAAPPVSEPAATQAPATQAPVSRPAVTVLNNSRRSGLAKEVAAQVRADGWPVARTGNFRGRIAASTLYYAAGQRAAAEQLARSMPRIRRVLLRFAGLTGSGLTLVVTRDWSA
jgi:hypothetical protein